MIISYDTDVGRVRKENQDSVFAKQIDENAALLIVADGMGGHNGGKTASTGAIESIASKILQNYHRNMSDEDVEVILREAIAGANSSIYEKSFLNTDLHGMGTTVVAALILGDKLYTANVGDSRLYILSDGVLSQVTVDHSYVESLVKKGLISKDEARNHPQKNIITRAVGSDDIVDIDIFVNNIAAGDVILLCSDGLHGAVSEDDIVSILGGDIADSAKRLVSAANDNGGRDNISVIVSKICDEVTI